MSESTLRIGVVYPAVLGTYGDGGNAVVLAERARRRGFSAEIVDISLGLPVPSELDIYTLGGGEDSAQAIAADHLRRSDGLSQAARRGAPILAICASLQVLGTEYTDANNRLVPGLGLLDVVTTPRGKRAIGELITTPLIDGLTQPLTGFENHGGGTTVGADASPLGVTDGAAFCRELPERSGVAAIPLTAFARPERTDLAPLVRFAHCKRDEVLRDAVARLARGVLG